MSARPEAQTTALNPTPTTGTWWRRTRARVHDAARLRVQATNSLILDFKKPVARDALLRASEIAALDVADVSLAEQTVVIRRSKTDQEGAGAVQFLGKPDGGAYSDLAASLGPGCRGTGSGSSTSRAGCMASG